MIDIFTLLLNAIILHHDMYLLVKNKKNELLHVTWM